MSNLQSYTFCTNEQSKPPKSWVGESLVKQKSSIYFFIYFCDMRYYLVILFTVLSSWTFAREQWAIVVGISNYPESSEWNNINGANDIDIIVPMLQRNGFKSSHITTLANEQATMVNIKDTVNDLCGKIKHGDVVYFHFSGHGQLITDIDGDENRNESKGWDEALVPYDAMQLPLLQIILS